MTRARRLAIAALLALAACAAPPPPAAPTAAPAPPPAPIATPAPGAGLIGVEAAVEFVDAARTLRPFELIDGSGPAPADQDGWPLSDARTVLFDQRPIPAWDPPLDDPEARQPDLSGDYALSFEGQATITAQGGASLSLPRYDPAINTTSATLTLPPGRPALVILSFSATRRTPASPPGSGIRRLRAIRPGYPPDTQALFTDRLLRAYTPFAFIRVMGLVGTNEPAGDAPLTWADRSLPSDATQEPDPRLRRGKLGLAWEHAVALANATGKDLWVNVPAAASGADPRDTQSYVYQLAALLRHGSPATGGRGLDPALRVYVEHSNEVWNPGFPQHELVARAAQAAAARPGSPLADDGAAGGRALAQRYHAQRLYEIAQIFAAVFGAESLGGRVRPVLAGWTIFPEESYADPLAWLARTYGPPQRYLYGIAQTTYFNDEPLKAPGAPPASAAAVIAAMRRDSQAGQRFTQAIHAIAERYGLRHMAYEGGPDNGGGSIVNVGARIAANRDPAMGALVEEHFRERWFALGGQEVGYLSLAARPSRYGSWGLLEDLGDLDTPKYRAILALTRAR